MSSIPSASMSIGYTPRYISSTNLEKKQLFPISWRSGLSFHVLYGYAYPSIHFSASLPLNRTKDDEKSHSILFGNVALGRITNNVSIGCQKSFLNGQMALVASINVCILPLGTYFSIGKSTQARLY